MLGVLGVDFINYFPLKLGDYNIIKKLFCQLFRLFTAIYIIEIVEVFFRGFGESFLKGKTGFGEVFPDNFLEEYFLFRSVGSLSMQCLGENRQL